MDQDHVGAIFLISRGAGQGLDHPQPGDLSFGWGGDQEVGVITCLDGCFDCALEFLQSERFLTPSLNQADNLRKRRILDHHGGGALVLLDRVKHVDRVTQTQYRCRRLLGLRFARPCGG